MYHLIVIKWLSYSCYCRLSVPLSKCSISVLNLILSKCLIDDKYVYPLLVNLSYRQICQYALLISNIYICYWSTFFINKLIIYQDAKKKCFLLCNLKFVSTRSLFLLFGTVVINKLKADVFWTEKQSYCI